MTLDKILDGYLSKTDDEDDNWDADGHHMPDRRLRDILTEFHDRIDIDGLFLFRGLLIDVMEEAKRP